MTKFKTCRKSKSFNHVKKKQASIDLGEKDDSPIQDKIRRVPRDEPKTNVHDIR